jgi:membrane-bound ClpP family serine protease
VLTVRTDIIRMITSFIIRGCTTYLIQDITEDQMKAGDSGETITRLAPMGKIKVNDIVREAKSIDGYIDEHSPIEVVSVEGTSIKVKPIKK